MPDLQHLLKDSSASPTVLLQDSETGSAIRREPRWLLFQQPIKTLSAERLADVEPVLAAVEAEAAAGRWAAGFLSYEAGPALDPALAAFDKGPLPLTWWGIFERPRQVAVTHTQPAGLAVLDWRRSISRERYNEALESVLAHIAAGDTYQVNYTFPLTARFNGDLGHDLSDDAGVLFAAMVAAQRSRYSAFVDIGRFAVCSASPELFFALQGENIVTRPMKGTAHRGRYPAEDRRLATELQASTKNRAENLMIVDMMRNDLGKIALPGSVEVDELFAVETFPTVHQLTSTVRARTQAKVVDVLRALFPSASITGAPKVATSRLIRQLECGPRGLYTGSIGFVGPRRRAQFNVAIRTATLDRATGLASYGTGGGIVWDSKVDSEYEECRAKALVLRPAPPEFALLETLVWRPRSGYALLERHLDRLAASSAFFGYRVRRAAVRQRLEQEASSFGPVRHRVRLLAYRDGALNVTAQVWACAGREAWSITLDDRPIDDSDPFLFHKTTHRDLYDQALRRHPDVDEVVLWNARGELTESTRANLVLELDGRCWTPPIESGLLAGTYRAELLERGRIHEAVLPISALESADKVLLINSVRGWVRAERRPTAVPGGSAPSIGDEHDA